VDLREFGKGGEERFSPYMRWLFAMALRWAAAAPREEAGVVAHPLLPKRSGLATVRRQKRDTRRVVSEENIGTLVRRWSQAFNERDMDALLKLTSSDFEFFPYLASLIETTSYRGHDGLLRYFGDADAAWEEIQVRQAEVRESGDCTISFGELRGKGRASGLEVRVPLAWVGEWHDGKLVRLKTYTSRAEALEAAGLQE
jgi:ketosteroid isomerase-like protein